MLEDLHQIAPADPGIGQTGEARIECANGRYSDTLLDVDDPQPQAFDLGPTSAELDGREPGGDVLARSAGLIGEQRGKGSDRSRVQIVEQACVKAFGQQEIGLVKEPGEHVAAAGELPSRDVAKLCQHLQNAIERSGKRRFVAQHPPLDLVVLARQSIRVTHRPTVAVDVGTSGDGMTGHRSLDLRKPHRDPVSGARGSAAGGVLLHLRTLWVRRTHPDPRQQHGYGTLIAGTVRRIGNGKLKVTEALRHDVKVRRPEQETTPRDGQHSQTDGSLASSSGQHNGSDGFTPIGNVDDVTGAKPAQGLVHGAKLRGGLTMSIVETALQHDQLLRIPELTVNAEFRLGASAGNPLELHLEPDHLTIAEVLGEGQVEQMVRLVGRIASYEVHRHVVGWPKGRGEGERPSHHQRGNLLEGDVGRPEHQGAAVLVDATASGTAGQLGVLTRGEELVAFAGELRQLLDHHASGRHVDAQCQGLGRKDQLDEAGGKAGLHRFLERRDHACVMRADPRLHARHPPGPSEDVEVVVAQCADMLLADRPDAMSFLGIGQ